MVFGNLDFGHEASRPQVYELDYQQPNLVKSAIAIGPYMASMAYQLHTFMQTSLGSLKQKCPDSW